MKRTAGLLALSAAALASLTMSAPAAKKFESVGSLACAFAAGGAPDAILCEFQANKGGNVELYFALVDKPVISETATVRWEVLKLASAGGYKKGALAGEYAGTGVDGSLIGTGKDGIILQAAQGSDAGGDIRFFKLRTVDN